MAKKQSISRAERVLLATQYQVDGVIVLDGNEQRALFGNEDLPVAKTGKELVALGLSPHKIARLINEDYLIPLTNQTAVAAALPGILSRS